MGIVSSGEGFPRWSQSADTRQLKCSGATDTSQGKMRGVFEVEKRILESLSLLASKDVCLFRKDYALWKDIIASGSFAKSRGCLPELPIPMCLSLTRYFRGGYGIDYYTRSFHGLRYRDKSRCLGRSAAENIYF